ncbi:MAG TPA: MerR family transcriptional regulator, partial [Pseudonocardiaceae bacterium]|nr:MerR family transcriptional regulator [Pseudonocardiaceae bacterium]
MDGLWTIDELSAGVAGALAADYPGQSNGRVRDVPDRRTIRWYTTIGLLDRPAAMRGRTALYGRRHLLQLVAIKRLQADGRTLAAVQEELLGATTAMLESIARVPAGVPSPAVAEPPPDRERFWAAAPRA